MLKLITSPASAGILLVAGILAFYGIVPFILGLDDDLMEAGTLATLSAISAVGILIGAYMPFFKVSLGWKRAAIGLDVLLLVTWLPFVVFVMVAYLTADKIPIVAALQGASREQIAALRESFLKAREGWQGSFVYISAMLTSSIIPYTIALMFVFRSRLRWYCLLFLLVYSVSFLEKAYFLRGALPFLYLVVQRRIAVPYSPRFVIAGIIALLIGVTAVSQPGDSKESVQTKFFSLAYSPRGTIEFLVWRVFVVPVETASDAIRLFDARFDGKPLKGATSSLFASAFGLERVPFERLVFEEEWGQNGTATGSANSVYFTEAFVNFGYTGVLCFSLIAGGCLRAFRKSTDEAFRSMWILFCFNLFTAALIGLLFSNGFLLLFLLAAAVRVVGPERRWPAQHGAPATRMC